ncbi:MAG: hypothetical protein ACYCXA_00310, partial [Actinomycetes bacterium]
MVEPRLLPRLGPWALAGLVYVALWARRRTPPSVVGPAPSWSHGDRESLNVGSHVAGRTRSSWSAQEQIDTLAAAGVS